MGAQTRGGTRGRGLTRWLAAGALGLGAAACSPALPVSRQLESAKLAYDHAAASRAADLVPAELYAAKSLLDRATHEWQEEPGSERARTLAYLAERKAEEAEAKAGAAWADRQRAWAERQLGGGPQGALAPSDQNLTGAQLQEREQALEAERRSYEQEHGARIEAERQAQQALDALNRIVEVRNEPRGTVITIPGALLFAFGQADLLPTSRRQLDQVASVLSAQRDRMIVVEGHTDNTGPDPVNERLSLERAQSVRDYLIQRGVPASHVLAEGLGSNEPVDSNATAEGRADNRRVEIVVEGLPATPGYVPAPAYPQGPGAPYR